MDFATSKLSKHLAYTDLLLLLAAFSYGGGLVWDGYTQAHAFSTTSAIFPFGYVALVICKFLLPSIRQYYAEYSLALFLLGIASVVTTFYPSGNPPGIAMALFGILLLVGSLTPTKLPFLVVFWVGVYLMLLIVMIMNGESWVTYLTTMLIMVVWATVFSGKQIATERLETSAKKALYEQKELELLLDSLSTMIVYKDQHNTILKANKAHANFVGKTIAELQGKSLYDFLPHELAKGYHDSDLAIIKAGKPQMNVIEFFEGAATGDSWVRSDKKPLFDEQGKAVGIVIFSTNVTAQIMAETKLRESELMFRSLFEHAPYGIVITTLDKKILRANQVFHLLTQTTSETTHEQHLTEFLTTKDDSLDILYQSLAANPSNIFSKSITLHTPSGNRFIQLYVNLLQNPDGTQWVIGMFEDITEAFQARQELEKYSAKLEETNEELEQFSYIVSHDLKEPLRMITSYTQLLNRRYLRHLDTEAQEFVTYVTDGARRLNNMIDDLLQYSRAGRSQALREPVDINEVIFDVLTILRTQVNESDAEVVMMTDLPIIYCNKTQITSLFQNLIGNAIKYRVAGRAPYIEVTAQEKNEHWWFAIKDNGIGISEEHRELVFQIFRRLHKRDEYAGTGIGLAICKRIVQKHGGKIWVESTKGEGATFYFTLAKPEDEPLAP